MTQSVVENKPTTVAKHGVRLLCCRHRERGREGERQAECVGLCTHRLMSDGRGSETSYLHMTNTHRPKVCKCLLNQHVLLQQRAPHQEHHTSSGCFFCIKDQHVRYHTGPRSEASCEHQQVYTLNCCRAIGWLDNCMNQQVFRWSVSPEWWACSHTSHIVTTLNCWTGSSCDPAPVSALGWRMTGLKSFTTLYYTWHKVGQRVFA